MARQVLQRVGDALGLGDSRPPPPPQAALDAIFRMPSGGPETEEQARAREAAEEAHRQSNPRSTACPCGCMRWESGRGIDGGLAWLCANCRQRYQPRDPSQAIVRPAPPVPQPPPLPSPAEARQALVAAVEAVAEAVGSHDSLSKAAEAARTAVARTEQAHEVAEEAMAAARLTARDAAAVALQAGRAAPPLDLAKQRAELEKAADAASVARETRAELEAKQERARKALATAQAKRDEAALTAIGVEVGPSTVARVQALSAELVRELSRLGWLSQRRAYWTAEMQGLLALRGSAPRDWPDAVQLVTESDAALDRTVVALVNDPAVTVP
jgi:hypothetical protein